MGRRHRNKAPVPKTTWAISLEVDDMVSKTRGRHNTIDDFIKKVFEQWLEWKDTIPFMEEAYEKQSKINVHHVKEIEFKATFTAIRAEGRRTTIPNN